MNRKGHKGSITVFLSLACILFLSLICAVVESARVQGAKAQTANITGMGTFSVMGEFERELLEDYNIFSLNGTYGNGSFQIQKVTQKMEDYISYNANPKKDVFSLWCFDPWKLELTDCNIEGYALLTDQKGEPFYQQAVSYMKTNAATIAIDKLLDYTKNVDEIKENQENYENNQQNNEKQLQQLEEQQKEQQEAAEASSGETSGDIVVIENQDPSVTAVQTQTETEVQAENPLPVIAKLRRSSILRLVTWDKELSLKTIKRSSYPSKKVGKSGTMEIEKEHSGVTSNTLFREYLMMHFPNYLSEKSGKALDYQIEYILGGKTSDEKNLKHVVNCLLLLREGMNYLYCLKSTTMNEQAGALATSLTAIFGNPAITEATKHALLLAWSFGESLLDVRILLDNGKVPLNKSSSSWSLSLGNLIRVVELLRQGGANRRDGLSYEEYLRIFLNMGNVKNQRMRALDMIQAELQEADSTSQFKAENCIVAVKAETKWSCRPVFYSLPKVVMGVSAGNVSFTQRSSMAY